jgi:sugar lactone lactonase YvrE
MSLGAVRVLLLVTVLAVATSSCSSSTPPGPDGSPSASSPSQPPLLLSPVGLAVASSGAVWTAWSGSGRISSVGADGAPGGAVDVGEAPLRLVELDGVLWVSLFVDGAIVEVDPASGSVLRTVDVGPEPEGLAVLDGRLFVVLQEAAELAEVDPVAGSVVARYPVGGSPRQVATDGTALFVTDNAGGRIVRIVPGDAGATIRSGPVCAAAQSVLVLAGELRASCADSVVALDPATLDETGRVELDGGPDGLAGGPDGALLVTLQDGPALVSIGAGGQPQTLESWTSGSLADRANVAVAVAGGAAYVSDPLADVVHVVPL